MLKPVYCAKLQDFSYGFNCLNTFPTCIAVCIIDESCVMDQPTEDSVVPVRMNTTRSFVNKANNCNSCVDYFTPSLLSSGEVSAVLPLLLLVAQCNCDVTPKIV